MRSLLLLLLSIAILGGAFALYAYMQTPTPAPEVDLRAKNTPATQARPTPSASRTDSTLTDPVASGIQPPSNSSTSPQPTDRIIGAGDDVWVKTFDKENRLTNEFRAARYEPQGDSVNVTRPQARFYLGDGDVLVIEAERGRVVIPASSGQRETLGDSRAQTPTRGELYDVTLSLLDTIDAAEPVVRCTMNNITFDNDTFRIATEAFTDASGKSYAATEVPIQMRGRDYDFDGAGMLIRWNEVDRRLQLMEIARGDSLVVKNPSTIRLDAPEKAAGDVRPKQPASPIVVKWTGPLRVVPGKTSKTLPIQRYRTMLTDNVRITQDAEEVARADVLEIGFAVETDSRASAEPDRPVVISLSGSPAVVKSQGVNIRAAVVTYDTSTGSATLKSSPEFPQIGLQDAQGRTMLARQVDFDRKANTATLLGPTKFEVPLPADAAGAGAGPRVLVADATKQCKVTLESTDGGFAVKSAELIGDVTIDHPQLKLNCQTIGLSFASTDPNAEPMVREITADGDVRASMLDSRGQPQRIETQTLVLKTRSGSSKISPESMHAIGGVKIDSPTQQLSAGELEMTFAPRQGEAVPSLFAAGDDEVATLRAQGDVRVRSAEGASISAERVSFNTTADAPKNLLRVEGAPATIGDARGTLSAKMIDFDPKTGAANVVGGGRFNTVFAASKEKSGQPVSVIWSGNLEFDPKSNIAAITDGVTIESDQPDGVRVRGSANVLMLNFNATAESTSDKASPLAGREIRDVELSGNVKFAALQNDAAGAVAQRMHMDAEKLSYRPADGTITIPARGRMLVEDRRPEEKAEGKNTPLGSSRGATAFQWAERLSFTPASNVAEMNGDVLVVHQPSSPNAKQLRLNADTVSAQLADGTAAPTSPDQLGPAQLKSVKAIGNVRFNSEKLEFTAAEVELKPQEDLLIARGAPGVPASLLDQGGMSKGSFSELWMNTRTNESSVKDFRASIRR